MNVKYMDNGEQRKEKESRVKSFLGSDKGMRLVNLFVVLALILRNRGMIFLACGLWIACLVCSMKQAESKGTKVINGIFIAVAAGMIAVNAYFGIRG